MFNSVEAISAKYLTAKKLSGGTRKEYNSTVTKWTAWGNGFVKMIPVGNCESCRRKGGATVIASGDHESWL